MCVAYPGRVIEIKNNIAKVDFNGNLVDVRTGLVDVKIGEYLLVHAGCAIEAMSEKKAMDIMEIFSGLEDAF